MSLAIAPSLINTATCNDAEQHHHHNVLDPRINHSTMSMPMTTQSTTLTRDDITNYESELLIHADLNNLHKYNTYGYYHITYTNDHGELIHAIAKPVYLLRHNNMPGIEVTNWIVTNIINPACIDADNHLTISWNDMIADDKPISCQHIYLADLLVHDIKVHNIVESNVYRLLDVYINSCIDFKLYGVH